LCERLVDDDALDSEAAALAARIAGAPPLAVQGAKRAVEAAGRVPIAEGLVVEAEAQAVALGSEDMREAISAFVEQRDPKYTGR
jgi:enoyl-CoA hydratase/carnithine racemase